MSAFDDLEDVLADHPSHDPECNVEKYAHSEGHCNCWRASLRKAIDALPEETTEWGILAVGMPVFTCRSEEHAAGMMDSTSPVIGPMQGRRIVKRTATVPGQWEAQP